MNIRPVGAQLYHAKRQTHMTKLSFAFPKLRTRLNMREGIATLQYTPIMACTAANLLSSFTTHTIRRWDWYRAFASRIQTANTFCLLL